MLYSTLYILAIGVSSSIVCICVDVRACTSVHVCVCVHAFFLEEEMFSLVLLPCFDLCSWTVSMCVLVRTCASIVCACKHCMCVSAWAHVCVHLTVSLCEVQASSPTSPSREYSPLGALPSVK